MVSLETIHTSSTRLSILCIRNVCIYVLGIICIHTHMFITMFNEKKRPRIWKRARISSCSYIPVWGRDRGRKEEENDIISKIKETLYKGFPNGSVFQEHWVVLGALCTFQTTAAPTPLQGNSLFHREHYRNAVSEETMTATQLHIVPVIL